MRLNSKPINRRTFLKNSALGLASAVILPGFSQEKMLFDELPQSEYFGRNTVYQPHSLPIRSRPSVDGTVIRTMEEDEVIPWFREVVGEHPIGRPNRRWVETREGFVYAPSLQKIKNILNEPITTILQTGEEDGMWVEVTVPYVNLELINPPVRSPLFQETRPGLWRLYYGQVIWADAVQSTEDGRVLYRINEKFGYGDIFLADATAFHVITPEEISPIHPEVSDKRIIVNLNQQTLSCIENGNNEVYFCRISSGKTLDELGNPVDTWKTPVGSHWIWRKMISNHMASNDGQGTSWDLFGIGWTSYFVGSGVAIHSTFWHNDFGTPKSKGCVNALTEDAKWIFRWTTPQVTYNPGDVTDNSYQGTRIEVIEPLY